MKAPLRTPDATYRVQLHAGFTFRRLAAIIPYLHELGISDIYASPIFRAAPGSTHGYDVCDQNEVNPELGGAEGLAQVSALLRERGMGLVLDFVSNHMGIEGPFNWRWIDVLENGPLSRYAPYFDIHWNPRQALLQERILVPMLHDFYGRVLEEGGIQLRYDELAFWVCYGSLRFPLAPASPGSKIPARRSRSNSSRWPTAFAFIPTRPRAKASRRWKSATRSATCCATSSSNCSRPKSSMMTCRRC
jgi:(1->4)-alpha-D-glucan 1-alpha-D-glucosylmutase